MRYFFLGRIRVLLCILLISGIELASGQQRGEYSVQAAYDSSAIPELFNTIPVGFTFSAQGNSVSTRGYLHGRLRWNELEVTTEQGSVRNGELTFDRNKVWKNDHQVTFRIRIKDTTLLCNLALPYVEQLRFNLYTDSLKRDNPFYLNVEGRFSSGRVYPLDTGMVDYRKTGGGTLAGNVLTVTQQDSNVHAVKVYAWLKTDPSLKDCVNVPVKILPDPSTLPTEQQLFDKWKKKNH